MQSDNAARLRSAGLAVLAPGAIAAAATAVVTGVAPGSADASGASAAVPPPPKPIRAKFKRHDILSGQRVPVSGVLMTRQPGRRVLLQVNRGNGWYTVDRAITRAGGRFHESFRPHGLGRYRMRVRLVGPVVAGAAAGARRPTALRLSGRVTVYRQSLASWYGPGFMGGRTACGQTLDAGTLGVANKTLPCGTRVRFFYHGRSVTARVVDRGPYVAGREWDLTPAVKARLGFPSTGAVWSTR
jgi:peptidoglycan lytic transglycosylase